MKQNYLIVFLVDSKICLHRIARRLIFQRVYEALGLENAVDTPGGGFYVSAAPLSMQTFEYFESLGIELQVKDKTWEIISTIKPSLMSIISARRRCLAARRPVGRRPPTNPTLAVSSLAAWAESTSV